MGDSNNCDLQTFCGSSQQGWVKQFMTLFMFINQLHNCSGINIFLLIVSI